MISATRDADRKPRSCPPGQAFLALLPQIRTQARCAFRAVPAERREELVAEVVAHCYVAFVRLLERGLEDVIYPTPLARFAIKRVRSGRPVAGRQNVNDVSGNSVVGRIVNPSIADRSSRYCVTDRLHDMCNLAEAGFFVFGAICWGRITNPSYFFCNWSVNSPRLRLLG
jgi:hypothetical protein